MGNGIENVLLNCMQIVKGETVLYLYDDKHSRLIKDFEEICKNKGVNFKPIRVNDDYYEESTLISLLSPDFDIGIFHLEKSLWHTEQRRTAKPDKRFVEIIADDLHFDEAISLVKPGELKIICDTMRKKITVGETFEVTTDKGTNITGKIGVPFFEDGDYSCKGVGGDFPFGEIGFSPLANSVTGKVIYDFKMQHIGELEDSTLEIEIANDEIIGTRGKYKTEFDKLINDNKKSNCNYITEIAFGINDKAYLSRSDKFHITEEKILGTVHFGHGARKRSGKFHFDGVIKNAFLNVGGCDILVKGEMA